LRSYSLTHVGFDSCPCVVFRQSTHSISLQAKNVTFNLRYKLLSRSRFRGYKACKVGNYFRV